jgi:hypothetical protein
MSEVKFKDSSHQYFTQDGKELISVSKFAEKFQPFVDWKKIAVNNAAKERKNGNNITSKQLLAKWANKGKLSSTSGTLYHNIREQELINNSNTVFYNVSCEAKHCITDEEYKYSLSINQLENNRVYPELMIYDLDYMICGQADKVIVTNDTIHVWDYKTDVEIPFKGFSNQWTKPRKLLPPISHLDDCKGNIYSLKMSTYMYLLWKANKGRFKPGELIIEHIHFKREGDYNNQPIMENGKHVVDRIDKILVPYRKKEVIEMLDTLKTKQ